MRLLSILFHIAKNVYNYALFILIEDYDGRERLMSKEVTSKIVHIDINSCRPGRGQLHVGGHVRQQFLCH